MCCAATGQLQIRRRYICSNDCNTKSQNVPCPMSHVPHPTSHIPQSSQLGSMLNCSYLNTEDFLIINQTQSPNQSQAAHTLLSIHAILLKIQNQTAKHEQIGPKNSTPMKRHLKMSNSEVQLTFIQRRTMSSSLYVSYL